MPTSMPTEHQQYVEEEYEKFMQQRQQQKKGNSQQSGQQQHKQKEKPAPQIPKENGFSPKERGMKRSAESRVSLTNQVRNSIQLNCS
jgi:hypothetical protein